MLLVLQTRRLKVLTDDVHVKVSALDVIFNINKSLSSDCGTPHAGNGVKSNLKFDYRMRLQNPGSISSEFP